MSDFAVAASYDVRGFVAFESKPKTATQRSTARRHRAAKVIPAITLDGDVAKALADVTASTGENVAACVRRLIADEALRLRKRCAWRTP